MLVNDKIDIHKGTRPGGPLGTDHLPGTTTLWQYIKNIDPDNL